MFKKLKTYRIVIIVFISFPLLVVFGFRTFTKSIYNQRTCEWANIDNLELHAKVNVPKIITSDCNYNETTHTKKAYFVVNKSVLKTRRYIAANKLNPVDTLSKNFERNFLNFEIMSTAHKSFYYKENKTDDELSYVLYNADEGKLWVTVQF